MAHNYFDDTADYPILDFFNFMADESEGFQQFRRMWNKPDKPPPSLMDIIGGWVLYGNATQSCGSYEVFLLAVITITDYWCRGDNEFHRWEGRDGVRQRVDVFAVDLDRSDNDQDWSLQFVLMHDALNRTLWDVISASNVPGVARDGGL